MTSVEDVFRPAFEEISRRQNVTGSTTDFSETTYFSRDGDGANLPYVLHGQNFALVTMGTNVLAPRPLDSLRPALRVYGAFDTKEEAREHAEVVSSLDKTCSLAVIPMRSWFILPQNEECRDNPEERMRRTEKRLQWWRVKQMEEGEQFKRRVSERLQPDEPSSMMDTDTATAVQESEDGTTEAEQIVYRAPRRLRTGGEVRGQGYVALSVIPDDVIGECLVNLHGFFESAGEADRWSRNVASRHVTDDDIFTAQACEWLYPNGETKSTTHYRNDELQRIMDAAERNPQAVQDYKDWKAQQDANATASDNGNEASDVPMIEGPNAGEEQEKNEDE